MYNSRCTRPRPLHVLTCHVRSSADSFPVLAHVQPFFAHSLAISHVARSPSVAELAHPSVSLVRFDPGRPVYALAGYFRSGNSWTRHLLQRATGLLTGSTALAALC